MIPILRHILSDNETLFEYERGLFRNYRAEDLCERLVALERLCNVMRNDTYYNGFRDRALKDYINLSDYFWKLPYNLSKEFFIEKNNTIYIRCEKHDEWMDLISYIPPSFIVAASFIEKFTNDIFLKKNSLSDFINNNLLRFRYTVQPLPYIPDLKYFVNHEHGLSDLHVHLNGTTESDILWNYILQNKDEVVKDFTNKYNKSRAVRKHTEQIIPDFTPDKLNQRIIDARDIKKSLIEDISLKILTDNDKITSENAVESKYAKTYIRLVVDDLCNNESMIKEILFYIMVMCELRKSSNDFLAQQFHHYLLIKGLLHRFVVMQYSQKGFPQFQLVTENTFRYGIENFYEQRFLQLSTSGDFNYLSLIEGRFSPKVTAVENEKIISKIIKGFRSAQQKAEFLKDTQLALIAHFIKRPNEDNIKSRKCRHSGLRNELKKKAIALSSFCHTSKNNNFLKGIDAAASEFDAGPEVFSQTYRYLRKQGIEHFTFHVGEDFRHVISGMRSIFEAVEFLELHPGDRLGHCTALGISPMLWSSRICNECYISQGEWLDNLVFLYSFIKLYPNEQLKTLCLSIESQISEFSYKIYGKTYPSYILEKAWKLRKYDPLIYLEDNSFLDEWTDVDTWDEREQVRNYLSQESIYEIFTLYHNYSIQSNGHNGYNEQILIPTCSLVSFKDLEILQSLLLQYLSEKGIVIETLPTSNLRISYYTNIEEYHLDKWLDNKHEKMLPPVVLGTDDPGIFMTNIFNEYARVYMYLSKKGYSATCRMEHISNIHNNSKIYNFIGGGKC